MQEPQIKNPAGTHISPPQVKLAYTRREAADALSVSIRTIDSLVALKELKAVRIGKAVRIPIEAVNTFLRHNHPTARVQ